MHKVCKLSSVVNRINRNIVECKLERIKRGWRQADLELIETLWNVNLSSSTRSLKSFAINRNIVECKYQLLTPYLSHGVRINRNIVECKYYL